MDAEELLDLGLTSQLKGDLIKAEDYLTKALTQNPGLKGVHSGLGDIYLKQDRIDMAEEMYTKEIEINPVSVKAHVELANVYILKGDEKRALLNFENALSISSNDWRALKGIGYIYFEKSETSKAVGWFRMAVDGSKGDMALHFWLALIYHESGFITEMDTEIEKVKAGCKNVEKFSAKSRDVILYILGKIAALQGIDKEAIKHLEELRQRIKIKNRKKFELGLFYDELDILRTLAEVYDKVGEKVLSNKIQEEIAGLTRAENL